MASSVFNTADYQHQLDEKAQRIQNIFADFDTPELEVYASPAEHYRMRAEFRVWHEGEICITSCLISRLAKNIV